MMKTQWFRGSAIAAGLMLAAGSASAQQVYLVPHSEPRSAVGFTIGGFFPEGLEHRDHDDTILADLDDLAFDFDDLHSVTYGGEYLFGLNRFLEIGGGVGFSSGTIRSVYRDFVNSNGAEIKQDLKLRIVPISATVRFLPLGRGAPVEPYVGGGVGIFNWKYSEDGEFVDFQNDNTVFSNRYEATGTSVGPILLAGLRVPIGSAFALGGEVRWQHATGDTGGINDGFLGDKIDLGGTTANFTVHFRF